MTLRTVAILDTHVLGPLNNASEAISDLESVLTLTQAQASAQNEITLLLATHGAQSSGSVHGPHASVWGLARSGRTEAMLALQCFDGQDQTMRFTGMLEVSLALDEPEAVLHERKFRVPRLKTAATSANDAMRLHFHARGAISNLFLEPIATFRPVGDTEALLRVRAVGLNFRDVLNVLGEYPGDPGPPGGDVAGVVVEASSLSQSIFGLGHAPLASAAIGALPFLIGKPFTLSFEQACTLPVTWSTANVAIERARLGAATSMIVQAAAGGVGLKAVEYAQWLHAFLLGTAGRPYKHRQLHATGVNILCSSRDGAAFAAGGAQQSKGTRWHTVLNSLSLDFIATSVASLGEGGAFEEIGKRGIWASAQMRVDDIVLRDCA